MSTSTTDANKLAEELAQDRPTIDAAIKSFMSFVAARSLTTEDTTTRLCHASSAETLDFARALLKAINQYTFSVTGNETVEQAVVGQIWNGLISSAQKPSRFLGRRALLRAWENGLPTEVVLPVENLENASLFLEEFEKLMKTYDPTKAPAEDSDSNLIWEESGVELERRRKRRAERAKDAKDTMLKQLSPMVEELPDEEGTET